MTTMQPTRPKIMVTPGIHSTHEEKVQTTTGAEKTPSDSEAGQLNVSIVSYDGEQIRRKGETQRISVDSSNTGHYREPRPFVTVRATRNRKTVAPRNGHGKQTPGEWKSVGIDHGKDITRLPNGADRISAGHPG